MKCIIQYFGPSYPQLHGTTCQMDHPHPNVRHWAPVKGRSLWWWTDKEKEIRRN